VTYWLEIALLIEAQGLFPRNIDLLNIPTAKLYKIKYNAKLREKIHKFWNLHTFYRLNYVTNAVCAVCNTCNKYIGGIKISR